MDQTEFRDRFSRPTTSHIPDICFVMRDGLPVTAAVQTGGGEYSLVAAQSEPLDRNEFLKPASGGRERFANPDFDALVHILIRKITDENTVLLSQMASDDYILNHDSPPSQEKFKAYADAITKLGRRGRAKSGRQQEDSLEHDAEARVLQWVKNINTDNLDIQSRHWSINGVNFRCRHIILRAKDKPYTGNWEIDESVAKTVLFAKNSLRLEFPGEMVLYDIIPPIDPTGPDENPNIDHFISAHSLQDNNKSIVFGHIHYGNRMPAAMIDRMVIAHETGHFVDPYKPFNPAICDGFAHCMAYGFSFDRAKYELRKTWGHGRIITRERLEQLFSLDQSMYGINETEQYELSASLLCYLYEDLCGIYGEKGPGKFMDFYSLICGIKDAVYSADTGEYILVYPEGTDSQQRRFNIVQRFHGNIAEALKVVNHGRWDKSDEEGVTGILGDYLEKINE